MNLNFRYLVKVSKNFSKKNYIYFTTKSNFCQFFRTIKIDFRVCFRFPFIIQHENLAFLSYLKLVFVMKQKSLRNYSTQSENDKKSSESLFFLSPRL